MTEEKYIKFMEAVANMRRLQKDYFRCKASATLTSAKRAERKVDDLILEEVGKTAKVQQNLFG